MKHSDAFPAAQKSEHGAHTPATSHPAKTAASLSPLEAAAISQCRLCGAEDLEHVYSFGDQFISGFWDKLSPNDYYDKNGIIRYQKWPLTLVICQSCELLQLAHNAPQELLYSRHYWYQSGGNATMKKQLHDVVVSALYEWGETPKDHVWLDIGANDGTLLNCVPEGFIRIGCEPASNLQEDLQLNAEWILPDFWSAADYWTEDLEPANIITAIGMLYDLEDPNAFVADMAEVLADDGIIVCQLMTLKQMLEQNDVGNVCHEHLEFYSLSNLTTLFANHGLEIFRVERNDVNGGSLRIYARHGTGTITVDGQHNTRSDIEAWIKRLEYNRDLCKFFVQDAFELGSKVWVYGASTKGNVILQWYGLTNKYIEAAADRNPAKHGLVMAGSGIPIKSEEEMREANPDYLLVLPYAFFDEFQDREIAWHARGGHWIVPLPEFRVV